MTDARIDHDLAALAAGARSAPHGHALAAVAQGAGRRSPSLAAASTVSRSQA
jgi:hypothetical protein